MILIGLDAVGKTTLLYSLGAHPVLVDNPGTGRVMIEAASVGGVDILSYDLGGSDAPFSDRIPPDLRPLFDGAQALLFVVDAADTARLPSAAKFLHLLLAEPALGTCPLLVFLNKQDLPNAINVTEAEAQLALTAETVKGNRRWKIQGTCTTTREGVDEGFEWLSGAVQDPRPSLREVEHLSVEVRTA